MRLEVSNGKQVLRRLDPRFHRLCRTSFPHGSDPCAEREDGRRAVGDGPDAERNSAPRLPRHLFRLNRLGQGLTALSALAFSVGPVNAQPCPTAPDTQYGIEVLYQDGSRSVITRDASGEVRESEYTDSEKPYIYITANGVLETGYIDPDSGAADSFSYSFATDDLLPLQPWAGREGEQITTDADGEELNRIPFSFRTRGATTIDIGGCHYAMVPLETYYFEPGDPSMVEFAYLTELAVPISVGYSYLAGGMGTAETSTPIGIRPVRERE